MLHTTHPSHDLALHVLEGGDAGPVFCRRCGAHSTQRLQRISDPCLGLGAGRAEASRRATRNRLLEGGHPGVPKTQYCAVSVRSVCHPDLRVPRLRELGIGRGVTRAPTALSASPPSVVRPTPEPSPQGGVLEPMMGAAELFGYPFEDTPLGEEELSGLWGGLGLDDSGDW